MPRELDGRDGGGAIAGAREAGELAIERFEMPQPIPPYLFAFAVGDLASRDLSPRWRVWAEPRASRRRRGSSPASRR